MSAVHVPADKYQEQAFRLALQYLGTGRFAVASWFTPVAGNLLHHAIEMLLKGCLVRKVGFDGLPKGRNGHDLKNLWNLLTMEFGDQRLAAHTATIDELQRFEHIRYPENLILGGGSFSVGFDAVGKNVQLSGPRVPEYALFVESIDELVALLFDVAQINADYYQLELEQEHASKYFKLRNKKPLRG